MNCVKYLNRQFLCMKFFHGPAASGPAWCDWRGRGMPAFHIVLYLQQSGPPSNSACFHCITHYSPVRSIGYPMEHSRLQKYNTGQKWHYSYQTVKIEKM
ncbi:unnamed protein product [Leptidea sinapis]|uniref:Uncharacterized protein n=1 Tax=Leptidea sinapis TaxID=189913 RepID=A0A5E4R466_9NEOP|nr:unnamed protein product [Leptidea sinapis]